MAVPFNCFSESALVGMSRQKVQDLKGFDRRLHALPKNSKPRSGEFVARLAEDDINDDVEAVFQALRKKFNLKRVEAKVSKPEPGWGVIETPHFVYAVGVQLDPDDISLIWWERSIRQIENPEIIGKAVFASVFDSVFDRIEFTFTEPIDLATWIDRIEAREDRRIELNYDSGLTHCSMSVLGIDANIHITASEFSVVRPKKSPTHEILASYLEISEAIEGCFV